jgi:hypothetical protein
MTQEVELKHKHSYSDEYRVQCGVRQLLIWRADWGLQKFREYLSKHQIDSKILNMFVDQWQKGNKGEKDKWI